MPDVFTKRKRSAVMAQIRSRGNRDTELALAKLLRAHGITGWRRQVRVRLAAASHGPRTQPGHVQADFVFPKQRVAIFVDGCFWHGCPKHSSPTRWLKKSTMPLVPGGSPTARRSRRTGEAFWRQKLAANRARDRFVNRQLRRQGWRVIRIWEHDLTHTSHLHSARAPQRVLARIQRAISGGLRIA